MGLTSMLNGENRSRRSRPVFPSECISMPAKIVADFLRRLHAGVLRIDHADEGNLATPFASFLLCSPISL